MMLKTNFGSVMGWMAWLYSAYFLWLLLELWFATRVDLIRNQNAPGLKGVVCRILSFKGTDGSPLALERDARILRILGSIGIPLAIAFHGPVGAIFGVVGARPYWRSGLIPIMFLIGALFSGGALLAFVTAVWGPAGDNYWIQATLPEIYILITAETAREVGVKEHDVVRLVSATNPEGVWDLKNGQQIPVVGKVRVVQGMRPGVVAVSWHYGHWAYGFNDVFIDGMLVRGDASRRKGLCPNAVMAVDPTRKNVTLQDLIGASASFYDSRVKLVKVQDGADYADYSVRIKESNLEIH